MVMPLEDDEPRDLIEVDLHGQTPEKAIRKVQRALHEARVLGAGRLLVITGRGWGNLLQKPVLRGRVEDWLGGPEGRRYGVVRFDRVQSGGALDVVLE